MDAAIYFPKESLVVCNTWDSKRVIRVTNDVGGKYVYMYDDALQTEVQALRSDIRLAIPSDAINSETTELDSSDSDVVQ